MDPALIAAVAAVSGSLVGGLTSSAASYWTQRRQGRRERVTRELERKEEVYTRFNELASELLLDSLDRHLDEPGKLVGVMTLTGRIRLTSAEPVLRAAVVVINALLASYAKPVMDRREAITTIPETLVQPLVAFTEACRAEREALLRQLR